MNAIRADKECNQNQFLLLLGNVSDCSQKAWGKAMGLELSSAQWRKSTQLGYKVPSNIILREGHYKVQHRWCLTPRKLSKMFPETSTAYWRYGDLIAIYQHVGWDFRIIRPFWRGG